MVLIEKQQAHFNELYRLIKKIEKKFSKPTFNTHLKHLIEAGYVKKTPDKGQLVTYSLNLEKIGKSKEIAERAKKIIKLEHENKKEFFSYTEDKQVNVVLDFIIRRKLHEIQARIEYELDPESFEKWFALSFWTQPMLERVPFWMIIKAIDDEVYRKRILKIINDILEK